MKKLNIPLTGLICILFAISVQAQSTPDQARNFQINETHTGSSSSSITPPLTQRWSVNFGQRISYPLIADGKVFVTVKKESPGGSKLYALNAADGSTLWSYDLGEFYNWSGLCYENGRVFTLTPDGWLRAFDGASGSQLWSNRFYPFFGFDSAPSVFLGRIYFSSGSTQILYAVSPSTGAELWESGFGGKSSPAVATDGLYVSNPCSGISKLNPANGASIWGNYIGCSGSPGSTPALYNGRLYLRENDPDYILDSQTGNMIGTFHSKSVPAFSGSLGFFLNGPKAFGSYGVLEAQDINTSIVQWTFAGDGHLQSSVIVANSYVYVGSDQGNLYALEAATGNQVWSVNTGTSIPYVDELRGWQPLTGFAAGEGIIAIPTETTLIAYESVNAPTITWDFRSPAANADGWNNTPVQFYFTPHGYPDGSASASPASPLQFSSAGRNQMQRVVVTDATHNTTATRYSPPVNIDLTAPVTTESFSGTCGNGVTWTCGPGQYTLTGSDALSGIRNSFYVWDNGPVQTYTGPFSISTEGMHTLYYWSEDLAGNRESAHMDRFWLDATPPSTQASVSGTSADGWYGTQAQVSLSGDGDARQIFFTSDGGPTQTYANPFSVSGEGDHVITYWGVDGVNNTETAHSLTIKIDASAPTVQLSVTGTAGTNGWYVSPSVQVELVVTDSLSGVAATYYGFDGGMTQTYAGPFTLNGSAQHQINIAAVDKVSNLTEQSRTVKIDSVGPTTQSSVSGSSSNGYYNGQAQVSLTASDNLSGVANTYYRIDGGATQTYSQGFNVSGDGAHGVAFWSVDVAGNTANSNTINVSVDATAPTTQASLSGTAGGGGWYTTPVQVTLSANDNFSGIANTSYAIDGGALQSYATPFTISDAGTHTITFSSKDQANNSEPQQSMIIKIDLSPPSTQAALSGTTGNDGWYTTPVQLTLSATDSLSGVASTSYAIDGGALQTYATPFTISDAGTHTITFSSKDQANNSEALQSMTVKIDVSAPSTQAAVSGNSSNGWYQNPAQVSLTSSDGASGVANSFYKIDGGVVQTYAAPFNLSGDGSHVVNYWSVDTAGNTEAQQSVTVQIDTTSPSTQISTTGTSGNNGWYRGPVQVSLAGADNQSGLANTFYSLDGGPTQTYSSALAVSSEGQHQLSFWSVDRLGNSETHQTVTIKIDQTGPTTQNAVSGPSGGGNYFVGAVQFSLTAADNLSGVAAIYYRIDGGATQTYSSAFTLSGDGTHVVDYWSTDAAGNSQNSYTATIRIDTTAPLTTATPSGTAGTNGWFLGPVQVLVNAADNTSGVQSSYYKIDGGATVTYSTPFSVSSVGTHAINFWSIDLAGNTEVQRLLSLKIDNTLPTVTVRANPTQGGHGNKPLNVTISGQVADTISGVGPVTYSVLDEYGITQPSGPVTVQANGSYSFTLSLPATKNQGDTNGHLYTITIRVMDQAGNVSTASATVKIT